MSTMTEKRDAARREVKYRERVYPRLIGKGTMTREKADSELAIMREIAEDYDKLAAGERLL